MTVNAMGVTTNKIDYLQRSASTLSAGAVTGNGRAVPSNVRLLFRVAAIGRDDKKPPKADPGKEWRLSSEDMITGLYGVGIPVAFAVTGGQGGVTIELGTWTSRPGVAASLMESRVDVVASTLRALYPLVEIETSEAGPPARRWPAAGLALGIPTAKSPSEGDSAVPLDRLIRALSGANWGFLVLASPAPEQFLVAQRDGLLNEMRGVKTASMNEGLPSPLTEEYVRLLEQGLAGSHQALATGGWRTSVYLFGAGTGYPRLASVWRAMFSGPKSVPESVRVFDLPAAEELAAAGAMPDVPGAPGPGAYRRPFELQTVLTSAQLAAYVHLPQHETPGYRVTLMPSFDAVPPPSTATRSVELGTTLDRTVETGSAYTIPTKMLTRHMFVPGVTGSGKTNTVFHVLRQVASLGVPFLVLEPAKREYRTLLRHPELKRGLQVFTVGDETVSPLRLNPFEVLPGASVSVHLDLLRSVFSASFGMWTPLPQLLEQCLHRVYADRGWDLASNENTRLDTPSTLAVPTLSELIEKVDVVIREAGYDERITSDMRASLLTRLEGLRTGAKGLLLDAERSFPMEALLERPTVIELEGLGDDDDKAFFMGLLLIRLAEYRRTTGQSADLRHMLVVEEAHRLLANVGGGQREEDANPRGKAVEAFANLLSEIRAYGQGVVIADQVPVKLDPQAIKNTNLKIAHRIVAADDRGVLAGAMAMDDKQARSLAIFQVGQAAVFSEGDDAPVLVKVPPVKDLGEGVVDDKEVRRHMGRVRADLGYDSLLTATAACGEACRASPRTCQQARRLLERPELARAVARMVLSAIEDAAAFDRLWPDVVTIVRANADAQVDLDLLLVCVAVHAARQIAQRRAAQAGWSYGQTEHLAATLEKVLDDLVRDRPGRSARARFQALALELHSRRLPPFPACERICTQDPPVCLYRHPVAEAISMSSVAERWREAEAADANGANAPKETFDASMDAAIEVIEFPSDASGAGAVAARRASLCLAQQMLARDVTKRPQTVRRMLDALLIEAGHEDETAAVASVGTTRRRSPRGRT